MSTILVAAADATTQERQAADYLCDGTADNVEIQAAIDQAESDGLYVVLSTGHFSIAAPVVIGATVTVAGMGRGQTVLDAVTGFDDYVFKFDDTIVGGISQVSMHGFTIDGHADSQSDGGGIEANGAVQCTFDHIHVINAYNWGLVLGPMVGGAFGHHNKVANSLFNATFASAGFGGGVHITSSDENWINKCDFEGLGGSTAPVGSLPVALLDQAGLNSITDCVFVGGSNDCIHVRIQSVSNTRVTGCTFDGSAGTCVFISGSQNTVSNCNFSSIGDQGTTPCSGVHLEFGATKCIIANNFMSSPATAGKVRSFIKEDSEGGTGENIYIGNAVEINSAPTVANAEFNGTGSIVIGNQPELAVGGSAQFIPYLPKTGGTITGDLAIVEAGVKGFKTRISGGSINLEGSGEKIFVGVWSDPDFAGTERVYLVLENGVAVAQAVGEWQWRETADGTERHRISALDGVARIGSKNGLTNIRICGYQSTAGAPTTGDWDAGDVILDSDGMWWLCVESGTPGTWVFTDPRKAESRKFKLLVYYGIPENVNSKFDAAYAAALFAGYDYIVIGEGLQRNTHAYHDSTAALIPMIRAINPGITIFGYINIAVTVGNETAVALKEKMDYWVAFEDHPTVAVDGIFMDLAGYDFEVPRSRFTDLVDYAHGLGVPVMVNAYNAHDVLGAAINATYNPAGDPTPMQAGDFHMVESHVVNSIAYVDRNGYNFMSETRSRAEDSIGYRDSLGIISVSLNAIDYQAHSPTEIEEWFQACQTVANMYSMPFGVNAYEYSAIAPNEGVVYFHHYDPAWPDRHNPEAVVHFNGTNEITRPDIEMVYHADHVAGQWFWRGPNALYADSPLVSKQPFITVGPIGTGADYTCGGVDDHLQIQAAIDAAIATGSAVKLFPGNYIIDAPLEINAPIDFSGANRETTILEAGNALNDYVIKFDETLVDGIIGARFADFKIDGHADEQTTDGGGISAIGAVQCTFERIHFLNSFNWGIVLGPINSGAGFGHHNRVHNCLFDATITSDGFGGGVWMTSSDENWITLCDFEFLGGNADPVGSAPVALLDQAGLQKIEGSTFVGGRENCIHIRLQDTKLTQVVNCTFDGSAGHSVVASGRSHVIANNTITSPGDQGTTPASGIFIEFAGTKIIVTNNSIETAIAAGKTASCIRETGDGGAGDNIIAGNSLYQNAAPTVALMDLSGAGSTVINNTPGGAIRMKRTVFAASGAPSEQTDHIIAAAGLSAGITITLPTTSAGKAGQSYIIKDEDGNASVNNILIQGSGGQTIEGGTVTISSDYGVVRVYSTGSGWMTW